ncbi:MAG: 50S ribosomal protein L24 [Chlamydiae bacterium]|nr:50S ribosomal protein L24 [Chlamydiota bacterium]
MSKWIRKGDQVKVIAGNDKGKVGEVLTRLEDRVLVQGVNIRKRHLKRTQQAQGARIVEMEKPVHISNVALCDKEGKILKIQVRQSKKSKGGEKEKELVYKAGNKLTLYRHANKPA